MLQYNPSISGSLSVTGSLIVTNGVIGTVNGVDIQIFSSSISQVVTNIQTATGSQEGRLTSIESFTSSTSARLNSIETHSASVDTTNTTQNTRLTNLEEKTGSLATTGSNTFIGTQVFTGSVYITQNLVVQGSSSLQNITASAVSIGTNTVILNTDNPAVRFGGISVSDSGSAVGKSGSLYFDSTDDEWIFVHQGNTSVTSSTVITGPETFDNIGSETRLTTNTIPKVKNGFHLYDSSISDDGNIVQIQNTTLAITGSRVGINTATPSVALEVSGSILTNNTFRIVKSPSDTVQQGPSVYLVGGSGASYTQLQQGVGRFIIFGFDGSNWVERLTINNTSGNVGIGITNPGAKLEISDTTNSVIKINATSDGAQAALSLNGYASGGTYRASRVNFQQAGTNKWSILQDYNQNNTNSLTFEQAGSPKITFDASANVGIGVTNPSSKLEVNGTETVYGRSTLNSGGSYTNGVAGLTVESNSWAIVDANVKRQMQRSIGYVGDYEQHVILLHPIYNATLIEFSKCYGTIHSTRGWTYAGRINDTYEIDTSTGYSSTSGTLKSNSGLGRLYTCNYGGVKYIALLPEYRTSATSYMFDGYIANNTGGETLKLITYRMSNSGTVVNSEINNSLTPFTEGDTFTNGLLYPRQGIRFASGATTLNYYEEGTFTPSNVGSNMASVTVVDGKYVRIGNQITVNARWSVSPGGTGQRYFVFNLPFAFNLANAGYTGAVTNYNNGLSAYSSNVGTTVRNSSGSDTQQYVEAVFTTNASTTMQLSMTYFTF
jgi:hypothetical protein